MFCLCLYHVNALYLILIKLSKKYIFCIIQLKDLNIESRNLINSLHWKYNHFVIRINFLRISVLDLLFWISEFRHTQTEKNSCKWFFSNIFKQNEQNKYFRVYSILLFPMSVWGIYSSEIIKIFIIWGKLNWCSSVDTLFSNNNKLLIAK